MDIKEGENKFYIGDENDPVAEITFPYTKKGVMVIKSTYVSEELRGQKVAALLLEKVVDKARAEGSKIIPECSYAERVMNRKDQYRDVLYEEKD